VPLASKSRQRWNRWANNDGPVGSVRRRLRMTIRSIGRTLCPRIPWAMSRTGPPTRSYPPLCRVARVEFGTVRCRSPCTTKTRGFSLGESIDYWIYYWLMINRLDRSRMSETYASTRLISKKYKNFSHVYVVTFCAPTVYISKFVSHLFELLCSIL